MDGTGGKIFSVRSLSHAHGHYRQYRRRKAGAINYTNRNGLLFNMKTKLESTNTIYRELFTVKFLHSGYETSLDNFLSKGISVIPDEDTKNLFSNYQMDYRFFNNVLVCYMRCVLLSPPNSQPKVPYINVSGNIRIRFLIQNSGDF